MKKRYQRIIVESGSEHSAEDESSSSFSFFVYNTLPIHRRLLTMKDNNSSTLEECIFEDEIPSIESTSATSPILIEPFNQDLDINSSRSKVIFLITTDIQRNADN